MKVGPSLLWFDGGHCNIAKTSTEPRMLIYFFKSMTKLEIGDGEELGFVHSLQ